MKFSIRDLLLVTVIVAIALGWWEDRMRWKVKVDDLQINLEVLSGPRQPTPQDFIRALRDRQRDDQFRKLADEAREKYGAP